MRATNGPQHKALVEVGGTPLIERNLIALFASGINDVVVVTSPSEPAITAYLEGRAQSIARRFAARLTIFVEHQPLGNIGVVGVLNDAECDLLIVYVDNLTTIALRDLLARHRSTRAALTIATHLWPLQNPFGELTLEAGFVRSYREKPVRHVRISSGTCVVGPSAAALTPAKGPCSAAELCAAVMAAELPIAAFEHEELWIDVNDAPALRQAELAVKSSPERFAL